MARAYGSSAQLLMQRESAYGHGAPARSELSQRADPASWNSPAPLRSA